MSKTSAKQNAIVSALCRVRDVLTEHGELWHELAEQYPPGSHERAYCRDKAEQAIELAETAHDALTPRGGKRD